MKLADLVGTLDFEHPPQKKRFTHVQGFCELIQRAYPRGLTEFKAAMASNDRPDVVRLAYACAVRALEGIHPHNSDIKEWHDLTCQSYDVVPAFYQSFLGRLCENAAGDVSLQLRGHQARFGDYFNNDKKMWITGWIDTVADGMRSGTLIMNTFDSVISAGSRMSGGMLIINGNVHAAGDYLAGGSIYIMGRAQDWGNHATGGKIFVNGEQRFPRLP